MADMACARLRRGEGRMLKKGGPWVYDNEIDRIEGEYENGDLVRVLDFDGWELGTGFVNTGSKLTVRMLSRKKGAVIDEDFFRSRVKDAYEYRKKVVDTAGAKSGYRVIFGEADFLPGLVVDKFADVLVVQSLRWGWIGSRS